MTGMTLPTKRTFGFESTTDDVLQGIDLTGKVALVTGGSSGLGVETARALSAKGAHVVITARDVPKAEKVAAEITAATGGRVDVERVELDSVKSIKEFGARFKAKYPVLHLLINNAGVMACAEAKTQDGFEAQFGTNHLGHFLLTALVTPALIKGAPSRIVNLSSMAHRRSPVVFDDIQFEKRPYDKWQSYGQAKTANALHAVELQRRLEARGVTVFSVHPGVIQTELSRHMDEQDKESLKNMNVKFKSVPQGAATSCYAATAPELEGHGGAYLEDCGLTPTVESVTPGKPGVLSYAQDPEAAKQLWVVSERLLGETFDL